MSTIDSSARLTALIRSRFTRTRPAGQDSSGSTSTSGADARDIGTGDMAEILVRRVGAIDPLDPERSRKALRVFLESVLLGEFGMGIANDPSFADMVGDVQKQMEADPELSQAGAQLSELLLSGNFPR